jgi:histidinol-phosphatase (PHP family)
MPYKTDYHVHTVFSDGQADAKEFVAAGIAAGFDEIGFSEHLNLLFLNQIWCMDQERVPEYISYIRSLGKQEEAIRIRLGLEVDYFPGEENMIFDFINPLDLDFIIGSVHYMGDSTVDAGPEFYRDKNYDDIFKSYFELEFQAIESGLFDIIAHCDLVRIFGHRPTFDPAYLYLELARKLAKHDVAFEINTNGKNKPLDDFYPDIRYLHFFKNENVPVCVNSDAHLPSRVGQYFDNAYRILKNAGYKEMCIFKKRERIMLPADF